MWPERYSHSRCDIVALHIPLDAADDFRGGVAVFVSSRPSWAAVVGVSVVIVSAVFNLRTLNT